MAIEIPITFMARILRGRRFVLPEQPMGSVIQTVVAPVVARQPTGIRAQANISAPGIGMSTNR